MKNVDSAFDEFLDSNKEEIYNLFQKWRLKEHRFQTGTRIKIKDFESEWILACIDGSIEYSWVNIENGTTFGGKFSSNINPLEKLKNYEWTLVYPIALRKE